MMPKTLIAAALALLLTLVAGSTTASADYTVGISDQNAPVFDDTRFQALEIGHARLNVPWDSLDRGGEHAARVDAWLSRAQARGIEPLIAFAHSEAPGRSRQLPSKATFARVFGQFRARYPWVTTYSPWNEVNHRSQPTWKSPRRAADYYNVVRARCGGCRIVAADILDMPRMERYVRTFKRYAKGSPRLWGLHNYTDSNRRRRWSRSGTRRFLRLVRGKVWLTETGGLVNFPARGFRYSESRAAASLKYMFRLASKARRVSRVYVYNWYAPRDDVTWDSGLTGRGGELRPGYRVVYDRIQALRARRGQASLNAPPGLPPSP